MVMLCAEAGSDANCTNEQARHARNGEEGAVRGLNARVRVPDQKRTLVVAQLEAGPARRSGGGRSKGAWHKMDKGGERLVNEARAPEDMLCGRYSLLVVVGSISNPTRVESSTSLGGAQVFMDVAGGFTAELPKLRVLAATTQIRIWRLVGEAGARRRQDDVTAAFQPRDRRDGCGLTGRWMEVWSEMWAREQVVRFQPSTVQSSRLRGLETRQSPRLQGAFVTRTQRMHANLGWPERKSGGWRRVGWALQNGSLSLRPPRLKVQYSSWELELARATTTDCDLLLQAQDQDCGVAPVDLGGPLDLDTLALALVI